MYNMENGLHSSMKYGITRQVRRFFKLWMESES